MFQKMNEFLGKATEAEKQLVAEMMNEGHNTNRVLMALQLSDADIADLMAVMQKVINFRKPKDLVSINWEGTVQDIRKGKPYFAILTNVSGKIEYKFVSTISYDSHKYNSGATAVFTGELQIGTVVRHRDGASWKNDYSEYSEITADGMKQITEIEAKRLLGIIK